MKAFIVAALLVAAVAGQSMDLMKFQKEKELFKFNHPMMKELLLKKLGYPTEKTYFGEHTTTQDLPMYLQEEEFLNTKQVLTIDELYQTELFREYLALPLFREYIQYPAFQKFVQSIYFQKFWQIPTFKQYFLNPIYFYKYIQPLVTLFKTEMTYPTTTVFDRDMIVNKNVFPVVTGFERDLLKKDINMNNMFVPTFYNQELKLKDELKAKYLLTKIYSHLYNIPEETNTQFLTKKMIVDPITGEYKYININNEKYNTFPVDTIFNKKNFNFDTTVFGDKIHYPVMDTTIFGDKLNKDVLIKKLLLNKMIKDDMTMDMDFTKIFGGEEKLVKDQLLKKLILNKMIKDETTMKTMIPEEFILREKMMKMNPMVARMMYGYNKLPVQQYNKFETVDTMDKMTNMFDMLKIKDLIKEDFLPIQLKKELKDKIMYNKIFNDKVNEMNTFETYEHIPKVVDFTTPMMGVRNFEKKMFPETMIKA